MKWNYFITRIFIPLAVFYSTSCNKSNEISSSATNYPKDSLADILTYQIQGMNPQITYSLLDIFLQFDSSITSGKGMVATFSLSPGAKASVKSIAQISGVTQNNFDSTVVYEVTSASGITKEWIAVGTNNHYTISWGLGLFLKKSVSNNRDYEWYYDQWSTGIYSGFNCGPTCAAMTIKWADSTYTKTPEDLRNEIKPYGVDWEDTDLNKCMEQSGVPFTEIILGNGEDSTRDILENRLDSGRIVILLLNMSHIRPNTGGINSRVDAYGTGAGHYIVVKGYRELDNEFYFEVYDPSSGGITYTDGTPIGKNRYYRFEDIYNATSTWGNEGWVISSKW
jgi:hypothetical protein